MISRISVSVFRPTVVRKKQGRRVKGKSQTWRLKYRDPQTKKIVTRSAGTRNKQAAQSFARELQDKLYRRMLGHYDPAEEHQGMTFDKAREEFRKFKETRNRPQTVNAYLYSLKAFSELLAPDEIRGVDREALNRFVSLRAAIVGPITVNKDLRHLKAFLNWCHQQHYIVNPPDFKGLSLDVDKSDPIHVCHDDIKSILQVLDRKEVELQQRPCEWWAMFIRIGLFTGMRRSELLGLRWSDIDFRVKSVKVAKEISKSRRDRTYESANQLCQLLADWRDSQPVKPESGEVVLPYDKNSRGLYRDWGLILDAAKIAEERKFTFHDLRSTCVSEMLESGVALPTVSAWVGHQSIGVTAVHYAETRSAKRKVAEDRDVA